MQSSLISVVIPTYNRQNTIIRAVNSVLNQTYDNIEIIIVDDCSVDETVDVVNSLKDPRIHLHKLEKNSGACMARNIGVALAVGKYIAFQDSDDEWSPNKLEKQMKFLEEGKYDFVSCNLYRVGLPKRRQISPKKCPKDRVDMWCQLMESNWISTQTILCKKECFKNISFDVKIKRYQDWDLALQAANFYKIGFLNEYLVYQYFQINSISKKTDNAFNKLFVINKHKNDIIQDNKKMQAQYYKSLGHAYRDCNSFLAAKEYFRSFLLSHKPNVLIFSILSFLGIMMLRHKILHRIGYWKIPESVEIHEISRLG